MATRAGRSFLPCTLVAAATLFAAGCIGSPDSANVVASPDGSAVARPAADGPRYAGSERLLHASRWFDGKTGGELDWTHAVARLVAADVVFLGETHTDRLTHDAELELLRRLDEARGGELSLALEMFERDVQGALDDYLVGRIAERDLLARARPWGNYATDYRSLVEHAKARALPVIASNLPADLRRKLARGGATAWEALTPAERALAPEKLIENPPEYWARVDNVTRGHGALGMGGAATESRLYDGQNLWDNTMAESIARERARAPGRLVLHVNGGFHSHYGQGTVWQLRQRAPDAAIATVQLVATGDLARARVDVETPPSADLLLFVEARARSAEEGVAAVSVARDHGYRLSLPHGATVAAAEQRLPLLIWCCDEGQTSAAALELWKPAIGDRAAIAVVEPSFPWLAIDGTKRGRWWFPGLLSDSAGLGNAALSRLIEQLTRADQVESLHLDPARVVVAGEGAGATVALLAARHLDDERFAALAFAPAARDELEPLPLPLPLSPVRAARTLRLWCPDGELAAWNEFTGDDGKLKLETTVAPLAGDRATTDYAQLAAVCAALGLAAPAENAAADALFAQLPDHPAGRLLARQLARRARAAGVTATPDLAITAAAFADGKRLPLSSGSFGGTTIVVLPDGATADELAAWRALENPDVIQARSRFHRLRIAQGDGEQSPRAVIEKLRAENSQRRDFLLVPAQPSVDEPELARLRDALGPLAAELHLELLPGLGAALPIGNR